MILILIILICIFVQIQNTGNIINSSEELNQGEALEVLLYKLHLWTKWGRLDTGHWKSVPCPMS